ncbi:hypothetical protein D3C84_803840 [compost metagenome]
MRIADVCVTAGGVAFSRLTTVSQAHFVLDEMDSSRAGSLPQGTAVLPTPRSSVGARLLAIASTITPVRGVTGGEWVGEGPPTLRIPTHSATTTKVQTASLLISNNFSSPPTFPHDWRTSCNERMANVSHTGAPRGEQHDKNARPQIARLFQQTGHRRCDADQRQPQYRQRRTAG